jgi:hypothetical protein
LPDRVAGAPDGVNLGHRNGSIAALRSPQGRKCGRRRERLQKSPV